jgi:hypothetical protein
MTDAAIFHLMPGRHTGDAAISLVDFANAFAARTNSLDVPDIHPAGAVTVVHWLDDMLAAAEAERAAEVARLARMVTAKVALERQWHADDLRSIGRLRDGEGR